MVGQCAHRRYPFGRCSIRGAAVRDLGLAFELFQGKLELFDLERELLRRLAEGHAAKLGELVTEGVDQRIAGRESGFALGDKLGRALCREHGCKDVWISVGYAYLTAK